MYRVSVASSKTQYGLTTTNTKFNAIMEKLEIDPSVRRIVKIFYQIGIWRNDEDSDKSKRNLFYFVYFSLFFLFIVASAYLSDDKNKSIFLVEAAIIIAVVIIKLFYILWKKEKILKFLYYRSTVDHSNENSRKIQFFIKFVHAFLIMLVVSCIFYVVSTLPMFSNEKMLPLFIKYTLSCQYSEIIYWVAYISIVSEIAFSVVCTSVSLFIWYAMLNFAIEYDELGNKFRNLGVDKATEVSSRKNAGCNKLTKVSSRKNAKFLPDLIILIKAHQNIFQYNFVF